jgi:hypothetical protein
MKLEGAGRYRPRVSFAHAARHGGRGGQKAKELGLLNKPPGPERPSGLRAFLFHNGVVAGDALRQNTPGVADCHDGGRRVSLRCPARFRPSGIHAPTATTAKPLTTNAMMKGSPIWA